MKQVSLQIAIAKYTKEIHCHFPRLFFRHLAQAENEEVSRRLEMTASRADADRDELGQLQRLYQEERAQAEMLEEALR